MEVFPKADLPKRSSSRTPPERTFFDLAPEDGDHNVGECEQADDAPQRRLRALLTSTNDGEHGDHQYDKELDGDLGMETRTGHHVVDHPGFDDSNHDDAGDQGSEGAVKHPATHALVRALHLDDEAAKEKGEAEEVQDDEDIEDELHFHSLRSRSPHASPLSGHVRRRRALSRPHETYLTIVHGWQSVGSLRERQSADREVRMSQESDQAGEVLRGIWQQSTDTAADMDADCSPTKSCRNMKDVNYDGFAEEGVDLGTAWRNKLAREGKLGTGSLADLVFGQSN